MICPTLCSGGRCIAKYSAINMHTKWNNPYFTQIRLVSRLSAYLSALYTLLLNCFWSRHTLFKYGISHFVITSFTTLLLLGSMHTTFLLPGQVTGFLGKLHDC